MSSGAYVVEAPIVGAMLVASYVKSVADDTREFVGEVRRINEEADRRLAELDAKSQRIQESCMKVIGEAEAFRQAMSSRVFTYETVSDRLAPQERVESTKTTLDVTGEDLLCMEIDPETGEVAYVILDYSDALAVENAKNSAQYKKIALASDIKKRIFLMASADKSFMKARQELVAEINRMLDDERVDFEYFRETVTRKLELLTAKGIITYRNAELWAKYCALCARIGRQPEPLAEEKLEQAVEKLLREEAEAEYYAAAKRAFFESAKELGLIVEDSRELFSVPGALITDSANPGFGLFFTDSSDSLLVEILDTQQETDTEEKKKQHGNMCRRRKQLEVMMKEKGYPLRVVTESDAMSSDVCEVPERKSRKETAAESMRRRRALNGRAARIRVAGGN